MAAIRNDASCPKRALATLPIWARMPIHILSHNETNAFHYFLRSMANILNQCAKSRLLASIGSPVSTVIPARMWSGTKTRSIDNRSMAMYGGRTAAELDTTCHTIHFRFLRNFCLSESLERTRYKWSETFPVAAVSIWPRRVRLKMALWAQSPMVPRSIPVGVLCARSLRIPSNVSTPTDYAEQSRRRVR